MKKFSAQLRYLPLLLFFAIPTIVGMNKKLEAKFSLIEIKNKECLVTVGTANNEVLRFTICGDKENGYFNYFFILGTNEDKVSLNYHLNKKGNDVTETHEIIKDHSGWKQETLRTATTTYESMKKLFCLNLLDKFDSFPSKTKKNPSFYSACGNGNLKLVKEYLKTMDPNEHDKFGNLVLPIAVMGGKKKVIIELLNAGANPELKETDYFGENALEKAEKYEQKGILKLPKNN